MAHLNVIPLKDLSNKLAASIIVNNFRRVADILQNVPKQWHGKVNVTGSYTFTPTVDNPSLAMASLTGAPTSGAAYARAIVNVDKTVTLYVYQSNFNLATTQQEVEWIIMED